MCQRYQFASEFWKNRLALEFFFEVCMLPGCLAYSSKQCHMKHRTGNTIKTLRGISWCVINLCFIQIAWLVFKSWWSVVLLSFSMHDWYLEVQRWSSTGRWSCNAHQKQILCCVPEMPECLNLPAMEFCGQNFVLQNIFLVPLHLLLLVFDFLYLHHCTCQVD